MEQLIHAAVRHVPWNKGKLIGQKAPLKLKDIGAIRVRHQIGKRIREHALFNLAIDSKLRSEVEIKAFGEVLCAAMSGHPASGQRA